MSRASGHLPFAPGSRAEPQHDDENAAWLGIALGVCFTVCFVTGIVSHQVQDPASWFHWRPARGALPASTRVST